MGFKKGQGGRPKGSKNKRTLATLKAIAESGQTPLAFMIRLMRNKSAPYAMRLDAAKSAAPFVHRRLAVTEITGPDGGPLNVKITGDDATLL